MEFEQTANYRIAVQEHLDLCWQDWFDGFAITYRPDGSSLLDGPVADQAALHGLLVKIRDLGLTLIAVNRVA